MDFSNYKSSLSAKQRDLLCLAESSSLPQVSQHFGALSQAEKTDHFFDYLLLMTALKRKHKSMTKFLIKNGCRVKIPMKTGIFYTPLYSAIAFKDISIVRDLVKKGASISDLDKNEISPVELAVQNEQFDSIDIMLDNINIVHQFSKLDPTCKIDRELFHMACWRGNCKAVKKFLEYNFSVNSHSIFETRGWKGFTPLHFALEYSYHSVPDQLLEHDIDFYATNDEGNTALLSAFVDGRCPRYYVFGMIKKYVHDLDKTKFSNPVARNGTSHFHLICCGAEGIDAAKQVEFVQFFLDNGVDIDSSVSLEDKYDGGYTALHYAVKHNHPSVVERLLMNGANSNKATSKGLTPLHLACQSEDPETQPERLAIVDLLLKYGADADVKDPKNSTPVHYAMFNRRESYYNWPANDSIIKLLLSKNRLTENHTNDYGLSYFHVASSSDLRAVEILMKLDGTVIHSCIPPNSRFKPGYSALHFAVLCDRVEIVEYLLDNGADPNIGITTDTKLTPLHVFCKIDWTIFRHWFEMKDEAARKSHQLESRAYRLHMMECLLERDASVNAEDSSGFTPLSYVCRIPFNSLAYHIKNKTEQQIILEEISMRQDMMIDKLVQYGATIDPHPLCLVIYQHACPQRKKLAESLLKKGAKVNSVDKQNLTTLHKAVVNFMTKRSDEDDGLIDVLLEYGADVNAKSDDDNTPLHLAIKDCDDQYEGIHNHRLFPELIEKFRRRPDFNINAQNSEGETALHFAVNGDDYKCIKILLDAGADAFIENFEDKTSPIAQYCSWTEEHSSALYFSGPDLDCFLAFVSHVKKLMVSKPSIEEQVQEYANLLSKICPERFAMVNVSIDAEVELLKARKIDHYTSLFNILSKNPNEMVNHSRNKYLEQIILSPDLKTIFPVFGDRLVQQFKMGVARSSILEDAKKGFSLVTDVEWPESCIEHVLMYLHNNDLKSIIESRSIAMPLKISIKGSRDFSEPPLKILRSQ